MTASETGRTTTLLTHVKVELALHELRPGTGRPLLLLHGLGERTSTHVPPAAEAWPGPVFGLDLTGHGGSSRAPGGGYTAEILMADVDTALAHLRSAVAAGAIPQRVHLLGVPLGRTITEPRITTGPYKIVVADSRMARDGRFIVTDLKSTNGTYVNGRKIAQATIVREGARVLTSPRTFATTRSPAIVSAWSATAMTVDETPRRFDPPTTIKVIGWQVAAASLERVYHLLDTAPAQTRPTTSAARPERAYRTPTAMPPGCRCHRGPGP